MQVLLVTAAWGDAKSRTRGILVAQLQPRMLA